MGVSDRSWAVISADAELAEHRPVKFPDIHINMSGEDGNAFFIIGRCRSAMKRAKCSPEDIASFTKEASNGNYDNLLQTVMNWFDVS